MDEAERDELRRATDHAYRGNRAEALSSLRRLLDYDTALQRAAQPHRKPDQLVFRWLDRR